MGICRKKKIGHARVVYHFINPLSYIIMTRTILYHMTISQ